MSNKTFTIVGTSNLHGKIKFRFANGSIKNRIAVLNRNEHTEVELIELPEPMSKEEAKEYFIKSKTAA